jgi:GMP synthase (glutamine-hydrolysing)
LVRVGCTPRPRLDWVRQLICVRHQSTAPLGIIEEVLRAEKVPWRYLDVWSDPDTPSASDASGLIVLGGEMNVDELDRHPFLTAVRRLTLDALESNKPVLGICLGAQVLARVLGSEVYPSPVKEIGFHPVRATVEGSRDPVMSPFAPEARVFQFHEDACDLPDGAQLLFTGDEVSVQAFRMGEIAYGIQFHFEVTGKEIAAWCDETPNLQEGWGASKEKLMSEAEASLARQQESGKEATRRFLKLLG